MYIMMLWEAILVCISIVGIWYVYKELQKRKKLREEIAKFEEQFKAAVADIDRLFSFETYCSFREEGLFVDNYGGLRKAVPFGYDRIGLPEELTGYIARFIATFDDIKAIRKKYNDDFVKLESERYADFFNTLEDYPLSADQVEAIIRDEDNNLVIAGAGTGKTTTIAGKVAYLLKKALARPEDLLIISFTNNAVKEMRERCLRFCQDIPDAEKLDVKTFNGFGYFVKRDCSKDELHLAFDGDDHAAKKFIQETFYRLFEEDKGFQKKAINFLAFFNRPERDEFAFKTRDEYLKHEESFKNVTLDGHKVNSKEEMEIGNFFCLWSVNYEYEKHYPLEPEDRNAHYTSYHPDFYLTDYHIWHEHYGIDQDGNVPQWFSAKKGFANAKETYHSGILWKDSIHQKYNTILIKTYSFENRNGTLLANLKKQLVKHGVTLTQRTPEEMLELVKKSEQFEDFINLIHTFLTLMKSNNNTPAELSGRQNKKRFKVFMDVFTPIYQEYERQLAKKSEIDYNDMINHACLHFGQADFKKAYKYILVDEFQDMSMGRYALLKSIRKQNPGVKLYAVGDDWQSIFRFTGSDISIITEFEKHFGFTAKTSILKTYRFNDEILKVSSEFIQRNPAQLKKSLTAGRTAKMNSFEFVGLDVQGAFNAQQQAKSDHVRRLLRDIEFQQLGTNVYLIGRYKHNVPLDLYQIQIEFPGLSLSYHTAHRVKGMTCDFAILLDVDSGTMGFPSEIADDPLLDCLLHEGDSFENAEERRVFYVAITRARHKNYLMYSLTRPSKFLSELREICGYGGKVEEAEVTRCPECHGTLIKRTAGFRAFYGCSNYPRCKVKIPVGGLSAS
jgi:DNA helicase-4